MFNGLKTCWVRGYHVYPAKGLACKICRRTEKQNMIFGNRLPLAPGAKLIVESDDHELGLGCPLVLLATFPNDTVPKNIKHFIDISNSLTNNNCDPPTPDELYDMIVYNSA